MHIFCPKNVHPLKTRCFMPFSSNFSGKYPCCHADIWSKLRQFCQYYTILWSKKVSRTPFLPIIHEKSMLTCPYFGKKRPFSKKTRCTHAEIFSKNVNFLKNTALSRHFFQIYYEKTPAAMPIYFVRKNVNSVKTTDYGQKNL